MKYLNRFKARSRWLPSLAILLLLHLVGCGGGGGNSAGGGNPAPPQLPTVGRIQINFATARQVPTSVERFRFTSFNSGGEVVYGPEDESKAGTVELTVPLATTRLLIEYFEAENSVGNAELPIDFSTTDLVVINDPDFTDVLPGALNSDATLALYQRLAKEQGLSWVPGDTTLFRLSAEDKLSLLGALQPEGESPKGASAAEPSASDIQGATATVLPARFDWTDHSNVLPPVRNQSPYGTCVAHALVCALESRLNLTLQPGIAPDLSEWYLYRRAGGKIGKDNQGKSLEGLNLATAVQSLADAGTVLEVFSPYRDIPEPNDARSARASRFTIIDGDHVTGRENIKRAIMEQGPVAARYDVYNDFYSWKAGMPPYRPIKSEANPFVGGHAIAIVGWDDAQQGWIIRNSWGADKGDQGNYLIEYGAVGIDDNVWSLVLGPTPLEDQAVLKSTSAQHLQLDFPAVGNARIAAMGSEILPGVGFAEPGGLSPDRSKVVFSGFNNQSYDLYTCNADFSEVENLTDTPELDEEEPEWAPNGNLVYYRVSPRASTRGDIAVMDLRTGQSLTVVANEGQQISSFAVGPSSDQICFARGSSISDNRLFIHHVPSGVHRSITAGMAFEDQPNWSCRTAQFPEGRIVFRKQIGFDPAVVAIEPDGGGETLIAHQSDLIGADWLHNPRFPDTLALFVSHPQGGFTVRHSLLLGSGGSLTQPAENSPLIYYWASTPFGGFSP